MALRQKCQLLILSQNLCAGLVARSALFHEKQDLLLQLVLSKAPSPMLVLRTGSIILKVGSLLILDGQKSSAPRQWLQQCSAANSFRWAEYKLGIKRPAGCIQLSWH